MYVLLDVLALKHRVVLGRFGSAIESPSPLWQRCFEVALLKSATAIFLVS